MGVARWALGAAVVALLAADAGAALPTSALAGQAGGVGAIENGLALSSLTGVIFHNAAMGSASVESGAVSFTGTEFYTSNPYAAGTEAPTQGEQNRPVTLDGTAMQLRPRGAECTWIITALGEASGTLASIDASQPTSSPFILLPKFKASQGEAPPATRFYQVVDSRIRFTSPGLHDLTSEIELRVWDCDIVVTQADGTPRTLTAGRTETPSTMATGQVDEHYFVLKGSVQSMDVLGANEYWIDDLQGTAAAGPVSFTGFSGSLDHGTPRSLDDAAVVVEGTDLVMKLSAPEAFGGKTGVSVTGSFSSVTVNGAPAGPSSPADDPNLLLATTAGIGLLATVGLVGAWVVHHFFFPLFPGIVRRSASEFGGQQVIQALRNGTRRRILKIIQERPGIQPYHVWKEVGGALGVTMRALSVLEGLELVRSLKIGRNKHFYENNAAFDERRARLLALLYTPSVGQTFRTVYRLGLATQKQIAEQLGLATSTVSERLSYALQLGLVEAARRDGVLFYSPAQLEVPAAVLEEPPGGLQTAPSVVSAM